MIDKRDADHLTPYFKRSYPNLARALETGRIYREGMAFVGLATDGVVVQVGSIHDPAATDAYLATHPSCADW